MIFIDEESDGLRDWEIYEDQIFEKLKTEFPDHKIEKHQSIFGRFSRIERQIDILVQRSVVGEDITIVVDCKHFSRNVDVKDIEQFIGMVRDVGAEVGILITNRGYSEAAFNRATNDTGIRVDVIEFSRLDEYEFNRTCQICPEAHSGIPGLLWVEGLYDLEGWTDNPDQARAYLMHCDKCAGHHIECRRCKTITPVYEMEYGTEVQCEGACGNWFVVSSEHDGKGIYSYSLTIVERDPE